MPWLVGFLVEVVVAYAVSWAINYFWGKKADPTVFSPKYEDNQAQVRSAVEAHKIVYGRSLTSGPLTFAATNGPNNQYMHLVVPLTGHEVQAIDTVYFDDISSDGTEFNKIESWRIVVYAIEAGNQFVGVVRINGQLYSGGTTQSWQGNHSRINMSRDVAYGLYRSIVETPGYASRNYTASVDINGATVTITGKTIGDEISVVDEHRGSGVPHNNVWHTDGGLGIPVFYSVLFQQDPFVNDLYVVLITKAHIFDIYKHLGSPSQLADSALVAENVGWTSNHRLRGRAYLYARLGFYADRWPTGIPTLKAEVRGRKVYDPRTALTAWSDNPALCIRDYLTAVHGLSAGASEVDDATVIAAANICDEYVLASSPKVITSSSVANPTVITATAHKLRTGDEIVIAGHTGSTPSLNGNHTVTVVTTNTVTIPVNVTVGGTGGTLQLRQKRYTCNGTITLGERPIDVIQKLLTSCDGTLVYSEGKYKIYAGAYTAPVGDLNESNLRSGLRIVAKPPRKNLFNGVRGTILDPNRFWQETDFPAYTNSTYATEDGETIIRDITLPFTSDSFAAQRLAKQILERSRQAITVVFPAKLDAFKYAVNDVVRVSISYLGWTNKEFRIQSWSLTDFGVDILMQEEASASYNWNNGDETIIDPAPNSTLPSVFDVSTPSGLTLTEQLYQATNTGGVRSRIRATWTTVSNPNLAGYVLTMRAFSDQEQAASNVADQVSPVVTGSEYHFEDLAPGYYYVSIHALTNLGVRSAESNPTQIILVGNTIPPADVTGFVAYQNQDVVVFSWNPVTDVDLRGYEIRYGPTGSVSWNSATPLTIAERGSEVTSALISPGVWTFFIKAQDTTDIYSTNAAQDNLVVVGISTSVRNIYQNPDWLGTKTGFVKHWTGKLIPDDQNLASSYTNFEWCDTFVPTPVAVCSYESPEIDIDFNDTVRAWAVVDGVLGPGVSSGTLDFPKLIDTRLNGGSYDGYLPLLIGFEEGRYFKFKFTHNPSAGKAVITQFQTALDKAQVTLSERGLVINVGGTAITFTAPFHNIPSVTATAISGSAVFAVISSITTTGFTASVFNAVGTDVGGTINFTAIGV